MPNPDLCVEPPQLRDDTTQPSRVNVLKSMSSWPPRRMSRDADRLFRQHGAMNYRARRAVEKPIRQSGRVFVGAILLSLACGSRTNLDDNVSTGFGTASTDPEGLTGGAKSSGGNRKVKAKCVTPDRVTRIPPESTGFDSKSFKALHQCTRITA